MLIRFLIFVGVLIFAGQAYANDCLDWFLKAGLAAKMDDCEIMCAVTPVDMGTFSCPSQCENLCSKSVTEQILSYVSRLTEGDKVVIAKMPLESIQVFEAKEVVDKLTSRIFKKEGKNDESDAFRHFVWSVLIAQKIGAEKAKTFLDAQEEDSTQSKQEKEMDLANNAYGLDFFKSRGKSGGALELDEIEKEALRRLEQKKLRVLSSTYPKIPGGYYSN